MKRTALVAGATGLIGRRCVDLLLEHPAYESVTVLVRNPFALQHPRLIVRRTDFDDLESVAGELAADDFFCALGTTMQTAGSEEAFRKVDFEYPVKLAALMQHLDARQMLVVSALGAHAHARIFYQRVKGELEEALRKIPFNALHIFRPSLLLGDRAEVRTGERFGQSFMTAANPLLLGPMRKYRAIRASDVAKAMVAVAQRGLTGAFVYESDAIQFLADSAETNQGSSITEGS